MIKSKDLHLAPDMVLKFIIYELQKQNCELKEQLQKYCCLNIYSCKGCGKNMCNDCLHNFCDLCQVSFCEDCLTFCENSLCDTCFEVSCQGCEKYCEKYCKKCHKTSCYDCAQCF